MEAGRRPLVLLANLMALLSVGALAAVIAIGRRNKLEILSSLKQGHFLGETASAQSARDRLAKVEALADSLATQVTLSSGRSGLKPLIWLHVPKTGSYFETTLVHWVCGDKVSQGFSLVEPQSVPEWQVPSCLVDGKYVEAGNAPECSTDYWNNLCGAGSFGRFTSSHPPLWRPPRRWMPRELGGGVPYGQAFGSIANVTDAHLSQVVMLFREPRQRAISGWFHDKHDCDEATTFGQYALCVSACHAQMLIGVPCGIRDRPRFSERFDPELLDLTHEEAAVIYRARIRRLGFVGLTEHWALTICLFHAMYGGDCLSIEFLSGRKGKFRTSTKYIIKDHNLSDYAPLDDDVYRVASEVFWHNVQMFGVSSETCARAICPMAAEVYEAL